MVISPGTAWGERLMLSINTLHEETKQAFKHYAGQWQTRLHRVGKVTATTFLAHYSVTGATSDVSVTTELKVPARSESRDYGEVFVSTVLMSLIEIHQKKELALLASVADSSLRDLKCYPHAVILLKYIIKYNLVIIITCTAV